MTSRRLVLRDAGGEEDYTTEVSMPQSTSFELFQHSPLDILNSPPPFASTDERGRDHSL